MTPYFVESKKANREVLVHRSIEAPDIWVPPPPPPSPPAQFHSHPPNVPPSLSQPHVDARIPLSRLENSPPARATPRAPRRVEGGADAGRGRARGAARGGDRRGLRRLGRRGALRAAHGAAPGGAGWRGVGGSGVRGWGGWHFGGVLQIILGVRGEG